MKYLQVSIPVIWYVIIISQSSEAVNIKFLHVEIERLGDFQRNLRTGIPFSVLNLVVIRPVNPDPLTQCCLR